MVVSAQKMVIKVPTMKSLGALEKGLQLRGIHMTGFKFLALAAFVGCAMFATVPKAPAQIAVEIGVAPECPYGYYDAAPYELCPLRLLRSGMVHRRRFPRCRSMVSWSETTSGDMSTIVFILNTVIADRSRNVGRRRSLHGVSIKLPTLKATKFVMDAATQVGESTKINRAR